LGFLYLHKAHSFLDEEEFVGSNCIILYVLGIPDTFIFHIKVFNKMECRYVIFMTNVGVNYFRIDLNLESQIVKKKLHDFSSL